MLRKDMVSHVDWLLRSASPLHHPSLRVSTPPSPQCWPSPSTTLQPRNTINNTIRYGKEATYKCHIPSMTFFMFRQAMVFMNCLVKRTWKILHLSGIRTRTTWTKVLCLDHFAERALIWLHHIYRLETRHSISLRINLCSKRWSISSRSFDRIESGLCKSNSFMG